MSGRNLSSWDPADRFDPLTWKVRGVLHRPARLTVTPAG